MEVHVCPAHLTDTDRSLGFWVVSLVTWVSPRCLLSWDVSCVCHLPTSLAVTVETPHHICILLHGTCLPL